MREKEGGKAASRAGPVAGWIRYALFKGTVIFRGA